MNSNSYDQELKCFLEVKIQGQDKFENNAPLWHETILYYTNPILKLL